MDGNLQKNVKVYADKNLPPSKVYQGNCIKKITSKEQSRKSYTEDLFVCDVCQKTFTDQNTFDEHVRLHTRKTTHVCNICHKIYARKRDLNVHIRLHSGEKPYACIVCKKVFGLKKYDCTLKSAYW